jgi:hypothetical protein
MCKWCQSTEVLINQVKKINPSTIRLQRRVKAGEVDPYHCYFVTPLPLLTTMVWS